MHISNPDFYADQLFSASTQTIAFFKELYYNTFENAQRLYGCKGISQAMELNKGMGYGVYPKPRMEPIPWVSRSRSVGESQSLGKPEKAGAVFV